MRRVLKSLVVPTLVAVALVIMAVVPAWAYFTASDYASGVIEIKIPTTTIREVYGEGQKDVYIKNEDNSVPVWVRARAYSASELEVAVSGDGWSDAGDGWWTYDSILMPGEESNPLIAKIEWAFRPEDVNDDGTFVTTTTGSDEHGEDGGMSEITVGIARGTNYNVIVVYEAQPVEYDASNNPIAPVWPYKGGE